MPNTLRVPTVDPIEQSAREHYLTMRTALVEIAEGEHIVTLQCYDTIARDTLNEINSSPVSRLTYPMEYPDLYNGIEALRHLARGNLLEPWAYAQSTLEAMEGTYLPPDHPETSR